MEGGGYVGRSRRRHCALLDLCAVSSQRLYLMSAECIGGVVSSCSVCVIVPTVCVCARARVSCALLSIIVMFT